MTHDLETVFAQQLEFSKHFYDVENIDPEERKKISLNLVVSMHEEVSSLLKGLDYKTHRPAMLAGLKTERIHEVSRGNLKFEAVDVLRYLAALMNLWDVSAEELLDAHESRDLHLNMRRDMEQRTWQGEPVVICDIDDVISRFKEDFHAWIQQETGVEMDNNAPNYYPTKKLLAAGHDPQALFQRFISTGELSRLNTYDDVLEVVCDLQKQGCWLHLVTARPEDDLTCKYDTFRWLADKKILADRVTFANEKYLTISTKMDYVKQGGIAFAVEDSSKHVREYAAHGIHCFVPSRSYNNDMRGLENVFYYESAKELRSLINNRLEQVSIENFADVKRNK